jgi:hypothetical protein
MILMRGDLLPANLKKEVLEKYVYRWTDENARRRYGGKCPACIQQEKYGGKGAMKGEAWHKHHLPMVSDEKWLREHAFYVTDDMELAEKKRYAEPAFMAGKEGVQKV